MKDYTTPATMMMAMLEISFWDARSGEPDGSFEGEDGTTIQLQTKQGETQEWGDLW